MAAAGINPVLAARWDASSPAGALANMVNPADSGFAGAQTAADLRAKKQAWEVANLQKKQIASTIRQIDAQTDLHQANSAVANMDRMKRLAEIRNILQNINLKSPTEDIAQGVSQATQMIPKATNSAISSIKKAGNRTIYGVFSKGSSDKLSFMDKAKQRRQFATQWQKNHGGRWPDSNDYPKYLRW